MTVAKIIEICGESGKSVEDAIANGIKAAAKTVHNVRGAWVQEQKVDNKIVTYRVNLKVTFVLD